MAPVPMGSDGFGHDYFAHTNTFAEARAGPRRSQITGNGQQRTTQEIKHCKQWPGQQGRNSAELAREDVEE